MVHRLDYYTAGPYPGVRPTVLHGVWQVWMYWHYWNWHVCVTDDFGRLVTVHAGRTHYSLLEQEDLYWEFE